MKVLITGSNGFIGKHLIQEMGKDPNISLVLALRKGKKFDEEVPHSKFFFDKLDSSTDWSKALLEIDAVVHLAGYAHEKNYQNKGFEEECKKVNVDATINLAKQAVRSKIKRFIYLSSVKVNGEETSELKPFCADDKPNPQDIYGRTKLQAELGLKEISKTSKMEIVIIRPVLVYGSGVKGNFLSLLKLLNTGLPLPLGSIENKRSFLSIKNLNNFIHVCLKHSSAGNQVFLVSDGPPISSKDLIKKLSFFLNKRSFIVPFPFILLKIMASLVGKQKLLEKLFSSLEVNIEKNLDLLQWTPIEEPDKTLEETVNYFLTR